MRHEVFLKTSNGRRSVILDDDFCQSLGVPDDVNRQSVALFIASWITLLSDSPLNPEDKPFRTYKLFLNRIREQGLKAVVLGFSDLAHELVSRQSLMGSGTSIGAWIDGFKDTPVFFEYNRFFKTGDVDILRFLYTFLNFGKKLLYEDKAFDEAAFRSWLDVEERLEHLELQLDDTLAIRKILAAILPSFTWRDLRPKFGPGAVQERGVHGRIGKLRSFRYDAMIDRFLLHGHIGMYGMGEDCGVSAEKIIPDPSVWTPDRGVSSKSARLMFVPKNLKTARSICMEPNVLMFFQQAIMRRFLELVDDSPLSRFVRIEDQTVNQELARLGSISGEIDTLDLTAASDSLTLELVKAVFPPSWQIPMLVTRSRDVMLPDGTIRTVRKFAPMGSALCFPTQCIIFASVCIYAACLHVYEVENVNCGFLDWLTKEHVRDVLALFGRPETYKLNGFQPFAVYGDDICVDRRLTDAVKSILCRLGFVVNDSKSFCGTQAFRESCGKFYLAGNDVTPLYFRIKDVRRKLTPSHVVSHVHLINECKSRRYIHLYRFLHHSLITWEPPSGFKNTATRKNPIPYVSDPMTFGILSDTPVNSHLQVREHPDYQRTEYRCWTISAAHRSFDVGLLSTIDAYEYVRWWAGRECGGTTEVQPSAPRFDTGGPGLKWRWIPLQ